MCKNCLILLDYSNFLFFTYRFIKEFVVENISKKVVSISEKKCLGYVLKPCIDFKLLKKVGYIVVDEDSEQEYFLSFDNIKKIEDCVLIESSSVLEFVGDSGEFRKRVLSNSGEDYGVVRDYVFQYRTLKKIVTNRCEIGAKHISDCGDDIIFISFTRKRKKFPRAKKEDSVVTIMEEKEVSLPAVINLSPSYYLGKVAFKTLLGMNNELIVKEGREITRQIFDKAKKHNRLNELFFVIK